MARTSTIELRVSPEEKDAFKKSADLSGLALSAWIRERLRHASVRELEGAGREIPFIESIGVTKE